MLRGTRCIDSRLICPTAKAANRAAYGRVYFRPRILRRVGEVDPTVPLLGAENGERTLPFYISPAAMAKLGHPDGELNLTRAAGQAGVVQGVSRPWHGSSSRHSSFASDLCQCQCQP